MVLRRVVAAAAALGVACAGTASVAHAADPVATQLVDPDASLRPKYRWWQPLAATDDQQLRNELKAIADNGGGGAEAVAFQVTHAQRAGLGRRQLRAADVRMGHAGVGAQDRGHGPGARATTESRSI